MNEVLIWAIKQDRGLDDVFFFYNEWKYELINESNWNISFRTNCWKYGWYIIVLYNQNCHIPKRFLFTVKRIRDKILFEYQKAQLQPSYTFSLPRPVATQYYCVSIGIWFVFDTRWE